VFNPACAGATEDFGETTMSEAQKNENAPKPQGTTHQSHCQSCKQPIEKANEHVEGQNPKLTEDARGLGPTYAGPIAIGRVDMIVGEGGVQVPGFVATKDEILQLVRYWATEIIDLDYVYFLYGCTGSSEWRTRQFANRRLNTISNFIGNEEVTKAFRDAEEAFGKSADPRAWKIFMEGTEEEQERFQREVQDRLAADTEVRHKEAALSYSQESLQHAYEMYEQGATHFAVMNETGLDRETAEWVSNRQLGGLGVPPAQRPINPDADKR
jgi:hypothetical protein